MIDCASKGLGKGGHDREDNRVAKNVEMHGDIDQVQVNVLAGQHSQCT